MAGIGCEDLQPTVMWKVPDTLAIKIYEDGRWTAGREPSVVEAIPKASSDRKTYINPARLKAETFLIAAPAPLARWQEEPRLSDIDRTTLLCAGSNQSGSRVLRSRDLHSDNREHPQSGLPF